MTYAHDLAGSLSALAKQQKTALCGTGPTDLTPMLMYQTKEQMGFVILMTDDIPEGVRAALGQCFADHGMATTVALISESYVKGWSGKMREEDIPKRGDLRKQFSEGDMSITEALTLAVFTADGERVTTVIPFTYDDDGKPCFHEPQTSTEVGGAVSHEVDSFFASFSA